MLSGSFCQQAFVVTKASMMARYRKSYAGLLWVILNPILLYLVQLWTFKKVLKISFVSYELYFTSAFLTWQFINQSLVMMTPQFIIHGKLIKNIMIDPLVIIVSQLFDNFINFILVFLIVLISLKFSGMALDVSWPGYLISFPLIFISMTSLGFLLAFTNVFFRDLQFILQFLMFICYFLTPIFYMPSMYPQSIQWIHKINPLYVLIRPLILSSMGANWSDLGVAIFRLMMMTIILFIFSWGIWKAQRNKFYFSI